MPTTLNGKEVIEAIVLDFDGTCYRVDSETDHKIWGELRRTIAFHSLKNKGISEPTELEIKREVEAYCQRAEEIGWTRASLETGISEAEYQKIVADVNKAKHLEFDTQLAGALEILLKELPVYVFTGSTRQSVLEALAVLVGDLWLDFEQRLLAMDDMRQGQKPNSEAYQEMIKRFKINPETTILVDDQLAELETAASLGLITFLISDRGKTIEPHLVLNKISQLLDYLDLN